MDGTPDVFYNVHMSEMPDFGDPKYVDVWADDSTGLPLKVEVYGDGSTLPVITSTLTDLAVAKATVRKPVNSATVISPDAMANSRWRPFALA